MRLSDITISQIFQSTFFARSVEAFSFIDVLLTLLISGLIGFMIYMVYKKCSTSIMYSHSFNISLVVMGIISAMLIMAVTSNIAVSLGTLGALSIVRFRTAVKDPIDIVYIFWSIAAGIITGAGMFLSALLGSLFLGIILMLLSRRRSKYDSYLLIVNFEPLSLEPAIYTLLKENVKRYRVKSKNIYPGGICELTLEVAIAGENSMFLNDISETDGVTSAVLVTYDGRFE